ncbi:MAG: tol-pal system protein YbgF [Mariprofundaceae bacterium]|nr:tol-pal system protein YbgF [Mariprofundaceae bacterium]
MWQEDKVEILRRLETNEKELKRIQNFNQKKNNAMDASIRDFQKDTYSLQQLLKAHTFHHDMLEARIESLKQQAQPQKDNLKKAAVPPSIKHTIAPIVAVAIPTIANTPPEKIEDEKALYMSAYLVLKSNSYSEAIQKFNHLLKLYPKGEYAHQAYYWLGESYLEHESSMQALQSFQHVVTHYPNSTKHAASMFKSAQLYLKINQQQKGKDTLQQLIHTHPKAVESQQAQNLLQTQH